jgi:hypothetical protein
MIDADAHPRDKKATGYPLLPDPPATPALGGSAEFADGLEDGPNLRRRGDADSSICVHDGEPTSVMLSADFSPPEKV